MAKVTIGLPESTNEQIKSILFRMGCEEFNLNSNV